MRGPVKWWKSNLPYPSEISIFDREIIVTTRDKNHSSKIHSLRQNAAKIRGVVAVIAAILVYVSILIEDTPITIRLIMATIGLVLAFLSAIRIKLVVSGQTTMTTTAKTTEVTTVSNASEASNTDSEEGKNEFSDE